MPKKLEKWNIPVFAVNKILYPHVAESIRKEGKADFVAMGRASTADPQFPNKVKEGWMKLFSVSAADRAVSGESLSKTLCPAWLTRSASLVVLAIGSRSNNALGSELGEKYNVNIIGDTYPIAANWNPEAMLMLNINRVSFIFKCRRTPDFGRETTRITGWGRNSFWRARTRLESNGNDGKNRIVIVALRKNYWNEPGILAKGGGLLPPIGKREWILSIAG